jgi:tetratricopeptide (TPR) repeat protein
LLLGESLAAQGDLSSALGAYEAALRDLSGEEHPDAVALGEMARGQMVLLLLRADRILEAERRVGELARPDQPESIELRGHVAIAAERWSAAREEIRKLRTAGETALADLLEAEVLIRSGRPGKAAGKVEEAVAAVGPEARLRLAEVYYESERSGEGERLLREWVAAEPRNPDARFHLGAFVYRSGEFAGAEKELREAIRLEPDHGPALNFLGYSLAERGERLEEALDLIQRALAGDPWNGAYLDSLGWVYVRLGRYEEARPPLERAAREHPADPVVLEHLGDLYNLLGERDLALQAWGRAVDEGPEDKAALRAKIRNLEESAGAARAQAVDEVGGAVRPGDSPSPSPQP